MTRLGRRKTDASFAQFLTLTRPYRFRVLADAEGFPVVPGKYGCIEWVDGRDLAVYSDHPRLFTRLWAIPGVRRHQTGDREMRAVFPPEAIEQVAAVIRARRRRVLKPEPARNLGFRTAYRATSGAQDARSEAGTASRIGHPPSSRSLEER